MIKATACMATLPDRRQYFRRVLESLKAQTTDQFVYFDKSMKNIDPKPLGISYTTGDKGAGGKFYAVQEKTVEGYILVCDDDLIYPRGYAEYMVGKLAFYRKLRGRAIVGLHAYSYPAHPESIKDKYGGRHCLRGSFDTDAYVNVLGTGTLCLHTDDLEGFDGVDFTNPKNLVDLRVAIWAQQQQIPMVGLARPADYLEHLLLPTDHSIWSERWGGPQRVANAIRILKIIHEVPDWKIFT